MGYERDDLVVLLIGDEMPDPRLWLLGLCNSLTKDQMITALVTLWAILWARRKAIHEGEFQNPLLNHLFIQRYLDDIQVSLSRSNPIVPHVPAAVGGWIPPQLGLVKINIDGVIEKATDTGAVAEVCHDDEGKNLGASAVIIHGITDPATLEGYACREALSLAEDLMLQKVKVASDCLRVIHDLCSPTQLGDNCMIIKEINARRSSFLACEFGHERCFCIEEAHRVARFATTLSQGRHLWLSYPSDYLCNPMNITT